MPWVDQVPFLHHCQAHGEMGSGGIGRDEKVAGETFCGHHNVMGGRQDDRTGLTVDRRPANSPLKVTVGPPFVRPRLSRTI